MTKDKFNLKNSLCCLSSPLLVEVLQLWSPLSYKLTSVWPHTRTHTHTHNPHVNAILLAAVHWHLDGVQLSREHGHKAERVYALARFPLQPWQSRDSLIVSVCVCVCVCARLNETLFLKRVCVCLSTCTCALPRVCINVCASSSLAVPKVISGCE